MTSPSPTKSAWPQPLVLVCLCMLFIALGWPFLAQLGIEVDEALVGNGLYSRAGVAYAIHPGGLTIPLMTMSYVGSLKTWICAAVFAVWRPDAIALRLPMMLVGVASIVLFFALLDRAAGRMAAWIGAALLATDPSFILIDGVDFGPVALNQFLKIAALWLLVRFHQRGSTLHLAGGFCLLGLAFWDKAIFAWALAGLAIAAVAVFPRELRRHLTARTAAIATAAFIAGALPLIAYNATHDLDTFRSNARFSLANIDIKLILLQRTLNGSAMFGIYSADAPGPVVGSPSPAVAAVNRIFGETRKNWTEPALALSILMVPLLWRTPARRPMLFALVFMLVTWLQMLFTSGAGGGAHHVILLWPFPLWLMAIALSTLAARHGRAVAAAAVLLAVLLCGRNLLVMNQSYLDLSRYETTGRWSDAFPRLERALEAAHAEHVLVADWGILETVNLMSRGTVPVIGIDAASVRPQLLQGGNDIFVTHPAPYAQLPRTNELLAAAAQSAGYRKEVITTVYDRQGRGIFEVFRYRRPGA